MKSKWSISVDTEFEKIKIRHDGDEDMTTPKILAELFGDAIISSTKFRNWVPGVMAMVIVEVTEFLESENGAAKIDESLAARAREITESNT